MNSRIQDARGQCYDGAATMAGAKTCVTTQIKAINGKCLYTRCYGHALNLAIVDSIKSVDCLKKVFEIVHKICKLVKKSPKGNTKLDDMRKEAKNESKGIHALCPTRWTVRGEALLSVLNNYEELMDMWEWSLEVLPDSVMKRRIRAVEANMQTFDFVFPFLLGSMLLKQTDNLSRTLQDPDILAAEGNTIAQDIITTIEKDLFWDYALKRKNQLQIEDPKLLRKRTAPRRLEAGNVDTYHFSTTPKECYRQVYFQSIDLMAACIKARFDQPDFANMSFCKIYS